MHSAISCAEIVRVLESGPMTARVELSSDELALLTNALNEILHGPDSFANAEFQTRTGITRDTATVLLHELSQSVQDR